MAETKDKKEPTLEEQLANERAKNSKLSDKVKDLNRELQVKEATAPKDALPTVKVGGEFYLFVSPKFRVGKTEVTAVEAAKDADMCAMLVEKGSGVLKRIETK